MTVKLPPHGGSDRQVATAVNQALDGKLACVKTVNVAAAAVSRLVTDPLVSESSAVLIVPTNGPAAAATVTVGNGSFTVSFNPPAVGGDLTYVVLG